MSTPRHNQSAHDPSITEAYPEFLNTIARPLGITKLERKALRGIDPAYWLSWSVSVLSGFESSVTVDRKADSSFNRMMAQNPGAFELMGKDVSHTVQHYRFRRGALAERYSQLVHNSTRPDKEERIRTINHACADLSETIYNTPRGKQYVILPKTPGAWYRRATTGEQVLEFPASKEYYAVLPLETHVGRIATLGPGLTGADFATHMLDQTRDVHFVSGGVGASFVNRFIERGLARRQNLFDAKRADGTLTELYPQYDPDTVQVPQGHYYDRGIADGMAQMESELAGQKLDAVFMSAVHHAGTEECTAGVVGASRLLRAGGFLITKLPIQAEGDSAGFDSLAPALRRHFGNPVDFGTAEPLNSTYSPHRPNSQHEVPTSFAVFAQP